MKRTAIGSAGLFLCLLAAMADAPRLLAQPVTISASSSSTMTAHKSHGSAPAVAHNSTGAQKNGANGNEGVASAVQQLPPMVITATRIAQPLSQVGTTVTVVSGAQIRAQKIQTVSNALREVPGVEVTQTGSPGTETSVSIRGASSAETLVMIDGVPVNTGSNGAFDLANLTTDGLSRIEVVRGAGGALYGSSAIGGVINAITAEGHGRPKFSLLSSGGNGWSERQVFTAQGSHGALNYAGAVSYFSTDGFRITNDGSDNLSTVGRVDYHLSDDTTIRGFGRYTAANVGLVNFSVASGSPINPNAHERNEFMLFKGEVDHRLTPNLNTDASVYFVRNDTRLNSLPYSGNPTSESDSIPDEAQGVLAEATYRWTTGFRTLVGFNFKNLWAHSKDDFTLFYPPSPLAFVTAFHGRRQEYAGYVEQEARLFHGLMLLTGGFRADGNSQFGEEVSPAWSVTIPIPNSNTTLRGSYSEGFRAPTFNDLYFPDFGNPTLQPEISSEYDGGFTHDFGEYATFTATYFSRRIHNLIVAVPCATCLFGSEAGNAGRVDTQGVEITPSFHPGGGFSFTGSFTYLDETHVSLNSQTRPLRVPKYSASAVAQYVRTSVLRPDDHALINLAYIFVGDRDDITTHSTIANHTAYNLFNLVVSYDPRIPWGSLTGEEIFARVQNLFDRHYSEAFGFRSPPINFMAGVKLDF